MMAEIEGADYRPPCELCGESMVGAHPRAKAHKACRAEVVRRRSRDWVEKEKESPQEEIRILPDLEIVEGERIALDGVAEALYKHLKHDHGLSKNGILQVIQWFRADKPEDPFIEVYVELVSVLKAVPFGDAASNMDAVCQALETMRGQDIDGKWLVY